MAPIYEKVSPPLTAILLGITFWAALPIRELKNKIVRNFTTKAKIRVLINRGLVMGLLKKDTNFKSKSLINESGIQYELWQYFYITKICR